MAHRRVAGGTYVAGQVKMPMIVRLAVLAASGLLASCSGGDDHGRNLPNAGLYATFAVGSETFHASITHPDGIAQARALWSGSSTASIPNAELVCSPESWNAPWHWHMRPETVRFAEATMEVCDGEPSFVEANCATFGAGRYCPWSAQMTELRDCSTDRQCPDVPR